MIIVNEENIEFKGTKLDLLTDICMIVHNLYTEDVATKDELLHLVEIGILSEEEIDKETEKLLKKQTETLADLILKALRGDEDDQG